MLAVMLEAKPAGSAAAAPAGVWPAPSGPAARRPASGSPVELLLQAAAAHDEECGHHLRRVGLCAQILARALDWPEARVRLIGRSAPLHDVGKLGVPAPIFHKAGALTEAEWTAMRQHSRLGHQMTAWSDDPDMQLAASIALGHHERWDGSGYPQGLAGEAIPLEARMVALVDTYDALRTPRTYKPGFSHERAMTTILDGDGRTEPRHFDPVLLDIFRRLQSRFRTVFDSFAG